MRHTMQCREGTARSGGRRVSFTAVEEWRDQEALAAHLRQPHVARLIAALPELGDGRPELAVHEVASGPLPLPR
jgi:quinol monooxygenase YgiN